MQMATTGVPRFLDKRVTNEGRRRSWDMASMIRVDVTMLLTGQIQNQALSPTATQSQYHGLLPRAIRKRPVFGGTGISCP